MHLFNERQYRYFKSKWVSALSSHDLVVDTNGKLNSRISDRSHIRLGIYEQMHPAYTIFNQEQKTFSGIWTEFHSDYLDFLKAYESDIAMYSSSMKFAPKPDRPNNSFDISMVPWFSFTAFDINVFDDGKYLLPIFTMGRFFDIDGRKMLPLAIQVHHAVCDGYHVGKFVELLQEKINSLDTLL